MNRSLLLLTALLLSAPAFAHGHGHGHGRWSDDDRPHDGDRYDDDQDDRDDDRYDDDDRRSDDRRYDDRRADDYRYDDSRYDDDRYARDQGPALQDFRDDSELAWSGEWVDTSYGTVWRPMRVDAGWQPYTFGHWAFTAYGWTWVSDEPFGWAVYHYGRWAFTDAYGWVWVPGRVWAPAWVAWRWNDGVVGWCPLGPQRVAWTQPNQWVFVETRYMMEPVRHHTMPIQDVRPFWHRTNQGGPRAQPPRQLVERFVGHAVTPVPVVRVGTPSAATPSGGSVAVYAPRGGLRPAEPSSFASRHYADRPRAQAVPVGRPVQVAPPAGPRAVSAPSAQPIHVPGAPPPAAASGQSDDRKSPHVRR